MDHDKLRIWVTSFVALAALLVVLVVVWISIPTADKGDIAHVATGAFTVIGTIIGLFMGHAAGASGKEKADERARVAELQSATLRAHIPDAEYAKAKDRHPNLFKD